ncbi:hypothetical protein B9Z19DRAFT_1079727 [Tuber borchii]|uniref:Uncharacterized protein n=1 Tax=Tuber borchii TaxID=42251 RepID=A0A2T6ZXV0_TUBBO|nr:hypothetical protein B9Z19DRAFT_1079727 [Tuber borchii]
MLCRLMRSKISGLVQVLGARAKDWDKLEALCIHLGWKQCQRSRVEPKRVKSPLMRVTLPSPCLSQYFPPHLSKFYTRVV